MKSQIITAPNQILRAKSIPVDLTQKNLVQDLGNELQKTLDQKEDPKGVGLSAPQIGNNLQAFATFLPLSANTENSDREIDDDLEENFIFSLFWNPRMITVSSEKTFGPDAENPIVEGCLSIPKLYAPVPRHSWIELEFYDTDLNKQVQNNLPLYELRKQKFVEIDSSIAQAF